MFDKCEAKTVSKFFFILFTVSKFINLLLYDLLWFISMLKHKLFYIRLPSIKACWSGCTFHERGKPGHSGKCSAFRGRLQSAVLHRWWPSIFVLGFTSLKVEDTHIHRSSPTLTHSYHDFLGHLYALIWPLLILVDDCSTCDMCGKSSSN